MKQRDWANYEKRTGGWSSVLISLKLGLLTLPL
jgi:hypothetical protein